MKWIITYLLLANLSPAEILAQSGTNSTAPSAKRINFFVSTKIRKFDPAIKSSQFQAWLTSRFTKNKFYYILAGSPEEMSEKVLKIVRGQKAMIGSIWFDSHGYFGRRRSLFEIGRTEFNYQTFRDSQRIMPLARLAPYCDSLTKVGIGSCYGGATYTLNAIEDFPSVKMNGDSLMIAMSKLLRNATVYASESFVMTKPGIFMGNFSLAGLPKSKKFRDPMFRSVWETIGVWNCYVGSTSSFHRVKTVCLTPTGAIRTVNNDYLSYRSNRKKLDKRLAKLRKGNYNIAYLYKGRSTDSTYRYFSTD